MISLLHFIGAPWGPQTSGWNIPALSIHTVAFVMMNWSEGEKVSVFVDPRQTENNPFHVLQSGQIFTDWTSTGSLSLSIKHE